MYPALSLAEERQRELLRQAETDRQLLRLRKLRRASRRADRAERSLSRALSNVHRALSDVNRARSELNGATT